MADIHDLISEIQKDMDLLEMIKSFIQNNITPEVVVKAIKSSGYDITEDEWISVFKVKSRDIDENALELIVGGIILIPPDDKNFSLENK